MPLSLNHFISTIAEGPRDALPPLDAIRYAETSLPMSIPAAGIGLEKIWQHLVDEIAPAFNISANYYGFVTGGCTPAAQFADLLCSGYDQNVQLSDPHSSIAAQLENAALSLLQQLLAIDQDDFRGRTFTTGCTASNILGLTLGREFCVATAGRRRSPPTDCSVAQIGLVAASVRAGIRTIQVLTTLPHSSIRKAAGATGIGVDAVIEIPLSKEEPWRFDLGALEEKLAQPDAASIIVISAGEVNTGRFATSRDDMREIRFLADKYGAWIHVDGAFGLQARVLSPSESHATIVEGVHSIQLADSIAGDAHKLLNVPYDCGFFFSRHLSLQQAVFQNGKVPTADPSEIPSAHNLGIECSRRLRALPVYASLVAYGRTWYRELLERQIELCRSIASFLLASDSYELLPQNTDLAHIYIIVLFRARSPLLNAQLVSRLNASRSIYVSGTVWDGAPATRIAVSTWRVDVERDSALVIAELERVVRE
ncbi:pyridoxal phosphate-dependent transferase, partial [Roridomyces roridus]